jgi:hypothetical protein
MVVAPRTGDVVKVQEVYRTPTATRVTGSASGGRGAGADADRTPAYTP